MHTPLPSLTEAGTKIPLFQAFASTEGRSITKRRLADREAGPTYKPLAASHHWENSWSPPPPRALFVSQSRCCLPAFGWSHSMTERFGHLDTFGSAYIML